MPFRIDNIGIAVTDLNVAVEFYQKLGFATLNTFSSVKLKQFLIIP